MTTSWLCPESSALQACFDRGWSYDILPGSHWLDMEEHVAFREFLCVFEQVDLGDAQITESRFVLNQEVAEGNGIRRSCRALVISSR
jgi:hypothetical protein